MKPFQPLVHNTYGKAFDPWNPTPDYDYDIRDIAQRLSRCNRYGGAGRAPYSVALHSVLASMFFDDPAERLVALMHDADEAWLHDLSPNVKRHLPEYKQASVRLTNAILAQHLLPLTARDNQAEANWSVFHHQLEIIDKHLLPLTAHDNRTEANWSVFHHQLEIIDKRVLPALEMSLLGLYPKTSLPADGRAVDVDVSELNDACRGRITKVTEVLLYSLEKAHAGYAQHKNDEHGFLDAYRLCRDMLRLNAMETAP